MGYIAYYRVSTKRQGESGLGLESQKAILAHYLDGKEIVAAFQDVGSGKDVTNRPELQKAVKQCVEEGHTLAVAKIDRLSRRTEDALLIWGELDGKLFSCDIPQDNGKMDKFTLTIFMAIADRERELIGVRTKAALNALKARGKELGTIDNLTDQGRQMGQQVGKDKAIRDYKQLCGYIKMMHGSGKSLRDIADTLNEEGSKTRTGKEFKAMTVKRILERAGVDTSKQTQLVSEW